MMPCSIRTTTSMMHWNHLDSTDNHLIPLHGQVIRCQSCGKTVWAASPSGPVMTLFRWVVRHWPDDVVCRECHMKAAQP